MKKIGLLVLGLLVYAMTLYGAAEPDTKKAKTNSTNQESSPVQAESRSRQEAPLQPSSSKAAERSPPKLIVLPFTGTAKTEGENLALLLSNVQELQAAYTIIPHRSVSNGQEIIRSGLLDTDTIAMIGSQHNADFAATGYIKKLGDRNLIIMSIVKIENFQQVAGTYREFQSMKEIPGLLSGMVKRMVETSRLASGQSPALGILPFAIPKSGISEESIETAVQLLTIAIANTGKYTVIPRAKTIEATLSAAGTSHNELPDLDTIRAIGNAINAQCVLTGNVMRLRENLNLLLAQILTIDTASLHAGGSIEYRTIADSLQLIPDLTVQLTGVSSAMSGVSLPDNMVWVAGGSFQMGSTDGEADELPVHTVQVSGFFLGKTPVTQKEYEAVMAINPSRLKGENLPVENVSWYDAVEYCNKLSIREGLTPVYSGSNERILCNFTANGYRLPTEAEWEYAARGGSLDALSFDYAGGNNIAVLGWFKGNSGGKSREVETMGPNSLGIYDMSGNVWEWCWDWYGPYQAESQQYPAGPESGKDRVNRGGSWSSAAVRSTYRSLGNPGSRYRDLGFRILRPVF